MPEPFTPVTHVDLRLVRYSLAVAAHRHFGRDAGALRVGQPSLSRQIRRLETQVGARLLDRTTRGTRLTEAREVFRDEPDHGSVFQQRMHRDRAQIPQRRRP
ncbi:hypothetical protein GCM10010348_70550 [Streptomyces anthocyanicus]|nr:hypothetical protein GCM10010348_70550 [Streptomyces anthocyanicus]